MPSESSAASLRVIILGTDALLEARPATPVQLARACLRVGYAFVAPVSWGEELLATQVIESVRVVEPPSSLIVHCPFVAEALRQQNEVLPTCWRAVSPPVATARYVRAAFGQRVLHITYAGRCPGASAPDVDAVVLPQVLLGRLLEAGVVPEEQPKYFEEMVPPDRSRYASLPGGVPDPTLLNAIAGARLREAAAATMRAVALSFETREPVVIDLETASGCVCARDRFAAAQLEPPRATGPVVSTQILVDLSEPHPEFAVAEPRPRAPAPRPPAEPAVARETSIPEYETPVVSRQHETTANAPPVEAPTEAETPSEIDDDDWFAPEPTVSTPAPRASDMWRAISTFEEAEREADVARDTPDGEDAQESELTVTPAETFTAADSVDELGDPAASPAIEPMLDAPLDRETHPPQREASDDVESEERRSRWQAWFRRSALLVLIGAGAPQFLPADSTRADTAVPQFPSAT